MRGVAMVLFHILPITCLGFAADPQVEPVPPPEAAAWTQYVVPLPKRIEIVAKVTVPPGRVAVVAEDEPPGLIRQSVRELRESLGQTEKTVPVDPVAFTVRLQQGGPESAALRDLKNADQAYRIIPQEGNTGLRLVGLTPHGIYYAAKTMQQLIKARAKGGMVETPILEVTDWPDMLDRGLWGSDAYYHLRWLSDRKMNHMEQIASSRVEGRGRHTSALSDSKRIMVDEGPTYGINPVPATLHLEQHGRRGLFDAYPELRGKGKCDEGAICYSNPLFVDVLADWIVGYARMPGVTEVDVWMSENLHGKNGCQCPACRPLNRDVQEARTIVQAWRKAKERVPDVGIRILTSEETVKNNERVFQALPPEVGIWYYHSLLTYSSSERPMVPGYLADVAKQGRRAGACFSVSPGISLPQPFTGASFAHYRMNEFVDKQISSWLGYATPRISYASFNVEAMAEWSWNAKGRSPREFALSWAIREGLEDPELFTEWSETLEPAAWDVYGSEWPNGDRRKAVENVAKRLRKGKLQELGVIVWGVYPCPWGDIKSSEQLNEDVARARRGVELARRMGIPVFLYESLAVEGYVNSLAALWELKQLVGPAGITDQGKQEAAGDHFREYIDGLTQAKAALPKWEAALPIEVERRQLTGKSLDLIDEMIGEMTDTARALGCNIGQ